MIIKKISTQGTRRVVNIPKSSSLERGDYVLITKITEGLIKEEETKKEIVKGGIVEDGK